jgi:predicted site-specific integrase-resolvase
VATTSNAIMRLLTEQEAADILNISARTLEAWRMRGDGPMFVRLRGHAIRYRRDDLEKFIAAGVRVSTSDTGNASFLSGGNDGDR